MLQEGAPSAEAEAAALEAHLQAQLATINGRDEAAPGEVPLTAQWMTQQAPPQPKLRATATSQKAGAKAAQGASLMALLSTAGAGQSKTADADKAKQPQSALTSLLHRAAAKRLASQGAASAAAANSIGAAPPAGHSQHTAGPVQGLLQKSPLHEGLHQTWEPQAREAAAETAGNQQHHGLTLASLLASVASRVKRAATLAVA